MGCLINFTAIAGAKEERSHVLFILIDDFGWHDVGYRGSPFCETAYYGK